MHDAEVAPCRRNVPGARGILKQSQVEGSKWLRADLAASTQPCTLAYWHKPRFTSGANRSPDTSMTPLWQALYDFNGDVVLSGHNHQYERFAPQDAAGNLDTANGLREFVAGTGGESHYSFASIQPNSEVRNSDAFGVLKLTLHANSYDWQFVPEAGKTFTDAGTGTGSCALSQPSSASSLRSSSSPPPSDFFRWAITTVTLMEHGYPLTGFATQTCRISRPPRIADDDSGAGARDEQHQSRSRVARSRRSTNGSRDVLRIAGG